MSEDLLKEVIRHEVSTHKRRYQAEVASLISRLNNELALLESGSFVAPGPLVEQTAFDLIRELNQLKAVLRVQPE